MALLLQWLTSGMTIAEIVKESPSLTEEAVRGTLEELARSDLLTRGELLDELSDKLRRALY